MIVVYLFNNLLQIILGYLDELSKTYSGGIVVFQTLLCAVIAVLIPLIFNKSKLKTEHRLEVQREIFEKRVAVYFSLLKSVRQIRVTEDLSIIKNPSSEELLLFNSNHKKTPAVFYNMEKFNNYYRDNLGKFIQENDLWLSRKVFLLLEFQDKYYYHLVSFIRDLFPLFPNDNNEAYQFAGIAFLHEIIKWSKTTEEVIIKQLNKPQFSSEYKSGIIYRLQLKKIELDLKKTHLLRIQYNKIGLTRIEAFKEFMDLHYGINFRKYTGLSAFLAKLYRKYYGNGFLRNAFYASLKENGRVEKENIENFKQFYNSQKMQCQRLLREKEKENVNLSQNGNRKQRRKNKKDLSQ